MAPQRSETAHTLPDGAPSASRIRHALSQEQNAKELSYEQMVLRLLLNKTQASHGPYQLEAAPPLSQNRASLELALGYVSFEALFEQWVSPQLKRARLAERRWLRLRNPDLPSLTPLGEAKLWHPLVRSRLLAAEG